MKQLFRSALLSATFAALTIAASAAQAAAPIPCEDMLKEVRAAAATAKLSDADKAKVAAARQHLEQPQALFALPIEAKCALQDSELDSPLFGGHAHDEHEHADEHGHSDIDASYRFACANAEALQTLELGSFFGTFPGTEKLEVQLIGPSGQQGAELTPSNSRLSF